MARRMRQGEEDGDRSSGRKSWSQSQSLGLELELELGSEREFRVQRAVGYLESLGLGVRDQLVSQLEEFGSQE